MFGAERPGCPKDLVVRGPGCPGTWKSERPECPKDLDVRGPGCPGTWMSERPGCPGTWMSGDLDVRDLSVRKLSVRELNVREPVNNWHLCGTCITLFLLHLYFSGLSNNVSAAAHSRAGASTRLCSFNPRQTAECSCGTEITAHHNTHIYRVVF